LEEAGHEVLFRGWPRWWLFEGRFFRELRDADLVVVQRRLLARWQLERVRRAVRALAFDFDDAIFLRDSFARRDRTATARRGFADMVQAADVVLAGNASSRPGWRMDEFQACGWCQPAWIQKNIRGRRTPRANRHATGVDRLRQHFARP